MLTTNATLLLALILAQGSPAGCFGIGDPGERLACYDAVFAEQVGVPDAALSYRRGQWQIALSVDPETGTRTVGLAVDADRDPTSSSPPTLLFRCVGGVLSTLIDWDTVVQNDDDETEVTTQIDAQRAETTEWRISADGTATYPPEGQDDAFLSGLYFASRLVARVQPEDESTRTASFNVSGLMEVAPTLWDLCPPR